jgi:uncharacterized RDD family membrane protein YckC
MAAATKSQPSLAPAVEFAGSKRCPKCRLFNVGSAEKCDCGYSFVTGATAPHSSLGYAGFWVRWAARLIDGIAALLVACVGVLPALAARKGGLIEPNGAFEALLFWMFALPALWCYFAVAESSSRQATFGKRALRLIVTDKNGHRISLARASMRWLLHLLTFFTLGIGYLMIAFMPRKQALHDWMAGTVVRVDQS